jgi:hypothetical protein
MHTASPSSLSNLQGTTMNTKLNRIAIALSGILFAGSALAGGGQYPVDDARVPTKSSAEVRAELKSAAPLIRGDVYPVLETTPSQRTREEVRAEARARPIHVTA